MDRRSFLRTSAVASASAFTLGTTFLRADASHPPLITTDGPYGPLLPPNAANNIRLPAGFTSREIARSPLPVEGTLYPWHIFPDGGATFATPDGGWIYVSNSEVAAAGGGAGAIRFDASGQIVDAYRILAGTNGNCAGGATPWGTWLSCEEISGGRVWECDPTGETLAQVRPALGSFTHEAAAVDPLLWHVYMTEDSGDGRFYRFTPVAPGDLSAGVLEAAIVGDDGIVSWGIVPNPNPIPSVQTATKNQVPLSTPFDGGEGIWFDVSRRVVYFATKGDNKIWEFDVDTSAIHVVHDRLLVEGTPLSGVDNVVVTGPGDLYVCEDGGSMEIVLITPDGTISPFLQVAGQSASEIAGAAFDPSGTRLYFSSQRGNRLGITYEVTGPFRQTL